MVEEIRKTKAEQKKVTADNERNGEKLPEKDDQTGGNVRMSAMTKPPLVEVSLNVGERMDKMDGLSDRIG